MLQYGIKVYVVFIMHNKQRGTCSIPARIGTEPIGTKPMMMMIMMMMMMMMIMMQIVRTQLAAVTYCELTYPLVIISQR